MKTVGITLAAGAIGGMVASFVMERYQAAAGSLFGQQQDGSNSATAKAADKVVALTGAPPLPKARKPMAGEAVHYATGVGLGLAYALAARSEPRVAIGYGTAFGMLTMLLLDDAVVPAAGLGSPAGETSGATHAYSLTSHLVFGASLEATRRSMVALLD